MMKTASKSEILFAVWALMFQIVLIGHFMARRLSLPLIHSWGWVTYLVGIPAAVISLVLMRAGQPWYLWLGGLLCLVWAAFGLLVEYGLQINWRSPIHYPVFIPYMILYLATNMFYWWPLARIERRLWFVGAFLFVCSTVLNILSH